MVPLRPTVSSCGMPAKARERDWLGLLGDSQARLSLHILAALPCGIAKHTVPPAICRPAEKDERRNEHRSGERPLSELKSNLIYDVGLHQGEDTDYYLKKGFDVIAFDANPELIGRCRARFSEAIASGRLQIIEGAIAPPSTGESVVFYKNPISVWGTIDPQWADRNAKLGFDSERIEVPRVDIGNVLRSRGIPFYLKIDVEGVDRHVLERLLEFEARPRYVSIESEKVDFAALRADMTLLGKLGYRKFKPVQQETVPGTIIKTRALDGSDMEYAFAHDASGPFGEDIPQPWLSHDETLQEYKAIFRRYRIFGDNSIFDRLPDDEVSRQVRRRIERSYRALTGHKGPLAGWHDIHAGQ